MKKTLLAPLFTFVLLFTAAAFAADDHDHTDGHDHSKESCEELLNPTHHVVSSGRQGAEELKALEDYTEFLFKKGGLVERLGLSHARDHIIQFLPGTDVNTIAANGRMPVTHWHDGSKLVKTERGGLLYEMVIFGGKQQHSIYRDDVPLEQQYSILNHVVGHVHHAIHGFHEGVRVVNINQAAFDFDDYIKQLRNEYDRDEISEWYQYLMTLQYAQDIVHAIEELPSQFDPQAYASKMNANGTKVTNKNHPTHATANILQAVVANLPTDAPAWKLEMAKRFEVMHRYIPGAIHTKIMNEGFATLLQELIPPHTPHDKINNMAHYCCMIKGVTRPGLSNPYWLGLEAWRNIRHEFNKRPGMAELSLFERDKAFLRYATDEIIEKMDDPEFLRLGLTEAWLADKNFSLSRKADRSEWKQLPPPPPDMPEPEQRVVITRDPNRVRENIIRQVTGYQFRFARPVLTSLGRHDSSGIMRLEISDSFGKNIPLDPRSMTQTLLVLARIMDKPVSIETTFHDKPAAPPPRQGYWWPPTPPAPPTPVRVRVTVNAKGEVIAERVLRDGKSDPSSIKTNGFQAADDSDKVVTYVQEAALAAALQKVANAFLDDLDLGKEAIDLFKPKVVRAIETTMSQAIDNAPQGLRFHVPTVPTALEEFWRYAHTRSQQALQQAIEGKRRMGQTQKGIQVRVLPEIPWFQFDNKALEAYIDGLPGAAPDKNHFAKMTAQAADGDLPLDIGQGGEPGEHKWGPGKPKGKGPGDGTDGDEPGDDPSKGNKPGQGDGDPAYMDFGLDTYSEMLAQYVTLPNLRPLQGKTKNVSDVPGGVMNRLNGEAAISRIQQRAYAAGIASFKKKKMPIPNDPSVIVREGMKKIPNSDWFVRSYDEEKTPDINALVVFTMDLSGSYSEFVKRTKQMFYDLRAILLSKYKNVKFRYIAFDGSAYDFEDPEEFFKLQLGGGTSYATAFEKTLEVYKDHPVNQWDRYFVLAGDMEDGSSPQIEELFEKVKHESSFLASVKFGRDFGGQWEADIEKLLKSAAENDDFVSFVDLAKENNEYSPLVLRSVFKNKTE